MSRRVPTPRQGVVLRARMSVGVGLALLALVAVLLADALLRGRWDVAVLALPALVLVTCLAVEVFLRPGIRLHAGGITVVNPLVTYEVPWALVADVTTRFLVAVETADGRRIRCWGAPTAAEPRGPAAVDRSGRPAARRGSRPPGGTVAHRVIEAHRAQYADAARRPADSSATARLDRKPHWMTLGLAAAMAVAALRQLLFTG